MVILLVRCRVAEKVERTDTAGNRWFMSVTTNWTFRHHKRLHRNGSGINDVLFSKSSDRPRLVRQEIFTSETPSETRPILFGHAWTTFLDNLCVRGATAGCNGVRHLSFLCHGCSMIEMVLDVHVVLPETFVRHDISQCCRLGHNDQDGLLELVNSQTSVLIGTIAALLNGSVFVSLRSGI